MTLAVFQPSLGFNRGTSDAPLSAQLARPLIWPLPSAPTISDSGNRMIFPYSVIPGGAQSQQELRKAVGADPVVARHYSDFDIAKVRRVTLSAPQLMYVSYRIGNNVFWTKHRMALAKGETMLTDGHAMARTRCGNRVSAVPVKPNALAEPTEEDFNAPVFPPRITTPYLAAYSAPLPGPPSGSFAPPSGPNIALFPPVPFFPLPGGGGGTGGGHGSTPPPGDGGGGGGGGGGGTPPPGGGGGGTPPIGVPEPGTAALLLSGLSAAWLVRRGRKA
jgi:hypothetical protein